MSSGMLLDGERISGQDVRTQNVTAAMSIANIVKSSLGPVGLDKMLVDEIGDVTITNDGATILAQLDIEHPAARVLVELAQLQDQEVGDGTTSVVILAAELLKRANELVKNNIHPTVVMAGYRIASREAVKYIKSNLTVPVDTLGRENLINAAKTSMSSKILGSESNFFSELAVSAVLKVKLEKDNKIKYPISNIHLLKCHGQSSLDSQLVDGFALNCTRAAQGMPTKISNAKIALLDFNLQKHKMQMGIQISVTDTRQVEEIRQREMDITKEKIQRILDAGARVILTTKGIDDPCLKYFVEAGAIAVRRVTKEDMRRISRVTGGQIVQTMADLEGNEVYDVTTLGECVEVCEERVGDGELLYFRGGKSAQACSIVLRGANEYMLDEMERALHDSFCVVKRMLESNSLVAGGGAVETALSIYLDGVATAMGSREQLAVAEFAESLLIIPRTLTVNAAHDATELVAQLRAVHNSSQMIEREREMRFMGLDLVKGEVRNNLTAGVVEPSISKVKSIKFATEAAISILRIDDMIKLNAHKDPNQGRR
mmetsp:Transcript_13026/g.13084  ORF Transcript_13026/g.13084 Transcript_13026/m.13084 type:complete len:544 (+) Transcript_13026:92-1723(+)|eukprot:CAMPEP_0182423892 /NCGR_PEP_ID=MMETSP1167-20130531/9940_1 /TAXON_ID=2988 /ORGANISM="Mallomonas Sp, Strain CCMP3275" /LENGTH=543 /DNA_ID=CAMNT_0024603231 /DNA_START=19 /DNA_END=1650 /DNA_ORIENTATION=+